MIYAKGESTTNITDCKEGGEVVDVELGLRNVRRRIEFGEKLQNFWTVQ